MRPICPFVHLGSARGTLPLWRKLLRHSCRQAPHTAHKALPQSHPFAQTQRSRGNGREGKIGWTVWRGTWERCSSLPLLLVTFRLMYYTHVFYTVLGPPLLPTQVHGLHRRSTLSFALVRASTVPAFSLRALRALHLHAPTAYTCARCILRCALKPYRGAPAMPRAPPSATVGTGCLLSPMLHC
ncbi:hypothetical protein EDB85DRAFT_2041974 [Lactarius pseudohatsudake]|nr:hypothetical protein EDB85DRAFT_2041974 [Lactarius pseudohatsudake]